MPKITVSTTIATVFDVPEGVSIERVRHLALPELSDNEELADQVLVQQDLAMNQVYLGAARQEALRTHYSISEGSASLVLAAPQLLTDLIEAAAQLRKHEALHWKKGTAESFAKAEVNGGLALRFEQTIAKATGVQPVIGTSSPLGQRGIQISQKTGLEPLP